MKSAGRYLARNPRVKDGNVPMESWWDSPELEAVLIALLEKHHLRVEGARGLAHGWQIRTSEGPVINIFTTGAVQLQGRRPELAREFVGDLKAEIVEIRHRRWLATGRLGQRP